MHYTGHSEQIFEDALACAQLIKREEADEEEAAQSLRLTKSIAESLPPCLQGNTPLEAVAPFDSRRRRAYLRLAGLSLIVLEDSSEDCRFSLHPLVHAWAYERQAENKRADIWMQTASALALSSQGARRYWPSLSMLLPHIRVCERLALDNCVYSIHDRNTALVLYQLSWILYIGYEDLDAQQGLLCEVRQTLDAKRLDSSVASQEIDRLEGLQELRAGRSDLAVKLFEHIVATRKQILRETHPDRLASQHELAGACMANGDNERAAEILEQVVATDKQTLRETHPDRLASQHLLARAHAAKYRSRTSSGTIT